METLQLAEVFASVPVWEAWRLEAADLSIWDRRRVDKSLKADGGAEIKLLADQDTSSRLDKLTSATGPVEVVHYHRDGTSIVRDTLWLDLATHTPTLKPTKPTPPGPNAKHGEIAAAIGQVTTNYWGPSPEGPTRSRTVYADLRTALIELRRLTGVGWTPDTRSRTTHIRA